MSSSKQKPPIKFNVWSVLALAFPLGLAPKAPGTFGSLAGIPLGLLLFNYVPGVGLKILALVLCSLFAWYVIHRTEELWQTHDDGRIVIDEVVGQAIPLSFISGDWKVILIAFGLFRFFDIVKPGPVGGPIGNCQGAWGTLLDDVIAGVFAWAVMAAGYALFA